MTDPTQSTVPVFQEYMNPMLDVLRGGTALRIEDLDRLVIDAMKLPPAITSIPHDPEKPDRSEVGYRMAWARTYLKRAGLLDNPSRGEWKATPKGRDARNIDAHALAAEIVRTDKDAPINVAPGPVDNAGELPAEELPAVEADEELAAARVGGELARQLLAVHAELAKEDALLDPKDADRFRRRFREKFAPEVLAGLDGEALLTRMHGREVKDSLVYWLEFKDDEEFSGQFGGIGGGSALKFGIYQAADTRQWMAGTGKQQERISIPDATARARAQRDQLLAGARVLEAFVRSTGAKDYAALERQMVEAAPELAESSWGHKYFSLLFPEVIAPIHGAPYQEHQLYKLLKLPGSGRYENARIFVGVAAQLQLTLLALASTLDRRNGGPHRYWRVGTTHDEKSDWQRMLDGHFMAVGWEAVGDLSTLERSQPGKDGVRALVEKHYPGLASVVSRSANQLFQFVVGAQERDLVMAMEGGRVLGIGRVSGGYTYQPGDGPFPHRRAVEWLRVGEWKLPDLEGLRTTFVPIRKPINIIEAEARLLGVDRKKPPITTPPLGPGAKPTPPSLLTGVLARIQAVLQRKRQVILFGPPGTGKTYWAERASEELAARSWFGVDAQQLDEPKRATLRKEGALEICSFHPAYGYEDFLEGYRPEQHDGALSFALRDGIFKVLCARASLNPGKNYYLIIDEINRGDIPRIFGELLTVLERDKRGRPITLPLSGRAFSVPDNVYVIGTMNTADRSIALLDAALRRRFGFVELLPDSSTLAGVSVAGLPLGPWLDELNRRVIEHAGRDARHLQVGHSYLLAGGHPVRDLSRFVEVLRDDIIPLLEEYCYEDFEALERILGPTVVQRAKLRIDTSLFEPQRHPDLIQALLSAFDGITATREAVEADPETSEGGPEDPESVEEPGAHS